jgi:hypothetical protein
METLSRQEQLKVVDYQQCLEMLRHEDGRKSQLFTVFLTIQGALFSLFGLLIQRPNPGGAWIAGVAIVLSALWFLVMQRMKAFIVMRRKYSVELEEELGLWTVRKEEEMRYYEKGSRPQELPLYVAWFSISNHLEGWLPGVIGGIWLVLMIVFYSSWSMWIA